MVERAARASPSTTTAMASLPTPTTGWIIQAAQAAPAKPVGPAAQRAAGGAGGAASVRVSTTLTSGLHYHGYRTLWAAPASRRDARLEGRGRRRRGRRQGGALAGGHERFRRSDPPTRKRAAAAGGRAGRRWIHRWRGRQGLYRHDQRCGVAQGTSATSAGSTANAYALETGGRGGNGYNAGRDALAQADSSLTNAVSGSSAGGNLYLRQTANGGNGGYAGAAALRARLAPAASSLTVSDTTSTDFHGYSTANGGDGGGTGGTGNRRGRGGSRRLRDLELSGAKSRQPQDQLKPAAPAALERARVA